MAVAELVVQYVLGEFSGGWCWLHRESAAPAQSFASRNENARSRCATRRLASVGGRVDGDTKLAQDAQNRLAATSTPPVLRNQRARTAQDTDLR